MSRASGSIGDVALGQMESVRAWRAARAVRDAEDVLRAAAAGAGTMLADPPAPAFVVGPGNIPGLLPGWLPRQTAMMVPAFARGLDLITGIASGLPLLEMTPDGLPLQPLGFTAAPSYEDGLPRVTTIRQTVADLVCDGRAYWLITEATGSGYPQRVQRLDAADVARNPQDTRMPVESWTVLGGTVDPRRVIEFRTGAAGALAAGAVVLNSALDLETAARNYARTPVPAMALVASGNSYNMDEAEAQALLADWETARQTRSTAYFNNAVELKTFGWSATEMQLVEARQHTAAEVARVLNLDPVWVGANASGSSLTYQNMQDLNTSLLQATILPLLRVIEQRLTMLTGTGRTFRFDTTAFLRANLAERVSAITAYIAAGVITVEEARDLEPMIRKGQIPA